MHGSGATEAVWSAELSMPVSAWWRHQGGHAVDELQRREMQFVGLVAAPVSVVVAAGFAALFGAAVHQFTTRFAQSFHGKGWACTITQQPLQTGAVMRLDANTGIHREPAVFVG